MIMKKLTIVKIGGNIIDNPSELETAIKKFALLPGLKLLVHGGGKIASEISARLNIKSNLIDGRRITDADSLEVVQMVYAGLINKNIVANLQKYDCPAVGLSGADANSLLAHKRPVKEIDYGLVGDLDQVNSDIVRKLIEIPLVPVFCALTHDGKGQILNTNADTIAAEIGIALSKFYKVTLIFSFEKAGVLLDIQSEESVLPKLDNETYKKLKSDKLIADGMIPKLDNAFRSLENGVKEIYITNFNTTELENNVQFNGTKLTLV